MAFEDTLGRRGLPLSEIADKKTPLINGPSTVTDFVALPKSVKDIVGDDSLHVIDL